VIVRKCRYKSSLILLQSLRTVPHLAVSWAHQSAHRAFGSGPHLASPFTPSVRPCPGDNPTEWAFPLHFERKHPRASPVRLAVAASDSARSSDAEPDTTAATYGSGSSTRLTSRTGSTLENGDPQMVPKPVFPTTNPDISSRQLGRSLVASPAPPAAGRSPITPRSIVSVLPNGSPVRNTVPTRGADAAPGCTAWNEDEYHPHIVRECGDGSQVASPSLAAPSDPQDAQRV
jgi:hypothetical protein